MRNKSICDDLNNQIYEPNLNLIKGNYTIPLIIKKMQQIEIEVLNPDSEALELWYDIRFLVFKHIKNKFGLDEIIHEKATKGKRSIESKVFFRLFKLILASKKNPILPKYKKYSYLFIGYPRRKLQEDGTYWDIYTDPISLGPLRGKAHTLEKAFNGKHFKPVPTECITYMDSVYFLRRFILPFKKVRLPGYLSDKLSEIENLIFREFKIFIPVRKIGETKYKSQKKMQGVFHFIFRYLKPEIIFLVCSYGKEYIIRAAKELGITTVELQHGVLNHFHVGYDFNSKLPKKSFPDYFFSFGSYWNKAARFPIAEDHIITVGYPFFERKLGSYRNIKKKRQVVFVSQGTIGLSLSKFAVDFVQKNLEIHVVYKLHPREVTNWKKNYPWLNTAEKNGKLEVVSGQEPDLYQLLAESMIQVGVYSTALFEGSQLGCFTYLLNLPGLEYMDEFIRAGYGIIVEKPEDIVLTHIEKQVHKKSDDFFCNGWEEKFIHAISVIKNNSKNIPEKKLIFKNKINMKDKNDDF